MRVQEDVKLDFSDVLIKPKRSTLESRKNAILERTFRFKHSNYSWTGVPIIILLLLDSSYFSRLL